MQMQKTTPEAPGAIFFDTFENGIRNGSNYNTTKSSCKGNPRALKNDAPFSEVVVPYFMTHPDNMYLNIHAGPDAIKRAERDANDYKDFGYTPSLCLPMGDEFTNYWWAVANLTIVLNWNYKDSNLQIEFANYLTHVCKARCVFTLLNGVDTKFMDASKVKITRRMAA